MLRNVLKSEINGILNECYEESLSESEFGDVQERPQMGKGVANTRQQFFNKIGTALDDQQPVPVQSEATEEDVFEVNVHPRKYGRILGGQEVTRNSLIQVMGDSQSLD